MVKMDWSSGIIFWPIKALFKLKNKILFYNRTLLSEQSHRNNKEFFSYFYAPLELFVK